MNGSALDKRCSMAYRLLLRHGLRPGRKRLGSPSFPLGLVIPAGSRHSRWVSSFPRRRESPVARWLEAPLGELPSPSRHAAKSKRNLQCEYLYCKHPFEYEAHIGR